NDAAWREVRVDLSDYAGQTVQLRLDFFSDDATTAAGVYVDELRILDRSGDPLAITATSLLMGYVGHPYAAAVPRTGGSQNARWTIVGGTNHEWLAIDEHTGTLSGVPPAKAHVTVRVRVVEPTEPWNMAEAELELDTRFLFYREDFADCAAHGWTVNGDWQCGVPTSGPN